MQMNKCKTSRIATDVMKAVIEFLIVFINKMIGLIKALREPHVPYHF